MRNNGQGRRDSNHPEALPEWMDDGPDSSNELMQLGGFTEQERRLEQNFQKLGNFMQAFKYSTLF
jgi:hypothetical protein